MLGFNSRRLTNSNEGVTKMKTVKSKIEQVASGTWHENLNQSFIALSWLPVQVYL
jgi:hypothetical protein